MTTAQFSTDDLEFIWERLASAIDQARAGTHDDTFASQKERLFLAKLALHMANHIADRDAVDRLIAEALEDLS